jgi:hypothetical protein
MNKYDTADFDEQVLKHLIRCTEVMVKAKELKLQADDFLSSHVAGVKLYREVGLAVLEIGSAPMSRSILELVAKEKVEAAGIESDNLSELLDWVYQDELTPQYIIDNLSGFIKHRRLIKVQELNKTDPVAIATESQKVIFDITETATASQIKTTSPFDKPIYMEIVEGIVTGFTALDTKLHGLAKSECGLIIGHSGSGKTTVATAMAKYAALQGYKSLYVSLEEPMENIAQRWYASQFRIPYTKLHYGLADGQYDTKIALEQAFRDMTDETRTTLMNLKVVDARSLTPINVESLKTLVEKLADDEGFIPDVMFIDQLDYVEPLKQISKNAQLWEKYQQAAFELDLFSQHQIQNAHNFALWVLHQGTGDPKWRFNYSDIAGSKAIVRPFDICLGVGRHGTEYPYVNLFTLKSRHTANVAHSYMGEFEYMSFIQHNWDPSMLNKKVEGDDSGLKRSRTNPNVRPKNNQSG